MNKNKMLTKSSDREVQEFLKKAAAAPIDKKLGQKGRVIFSMDATASRQPSWDRACNLHGEMFNETVAKGSLEIQLCYYRGFGEFSASSWTRNSRELLNLMTAVSCRAGETQIKKVLDHTEKETRKGTVDALIFIGDSIEEDIDKLGSIAGQLGLLGVPAFIFQEGEDNVAEFGFRQIAKLTNGAYCRLDSDSAKTLRELLRAVASYAVGGRKALENLANLEGGPVLQLANQISKSKRSG